MVGTDPITVYQGETFSWQFTVTDPTGSLVTLADMTIAAVIKEAAAEGPTLIPVSCVVSNAANPMQFTATGEADLEPGLYVFGARRQELSPTVKWQFVNAVLTVLDSPNED